VAWKLIFQRAARKEFDRLPQRPKARILNALERLVQDPYAMTNVKALVGSELFRLRVGNYRVMYRLENEELIVLVVEVVARKDAY